MSEKQCRNAIILNFKESDGIPTGTSKMGGFPDLPPEIEYPVMSGFTETWLIGRKKGNAEYYEKSAMQLVAQLNLYELAESGADVENLLQKKGMLYIFWSGEILRELKSNGCVKIETDEPDKTATYRVIYWDGDMSTLKRTEPPYRYLNKYLNPYSEFFAESAVDFSPCREREKDNINYIRDKLLGFPHGAVPPHIDETEVNLFQFDCYDISEGEIWTAYWIMKKSDLKNLDFSEVLLEFDHD